MNILLYSLFLFTISTVKCYQPDYYWREYKGLVPTDALPAGKDMAGRDTYIGQFYIHCHGNFIAQIIPGEPLPQTEVACYGVKKTEATVKILCTSDKDNFSWMATSADRFHLDTIGKHAVEGGYDGVGNKGILNIGRVMHQGILKIGHSISYQVENVLLCFAHRNAEYKVRTFEVLIYEEPPTFSRTVKTY